MKKISFWCFTFSKRQLKRGSTLFILSFLILMGIILRIVSTEFTVQIDVGFFMEDISNNNDSIAGIADGLTDHDGLIHFVQYSSKEQLQKDVQAGHIQCGYAFVSDFYESLSEGNSRKLVTLIEAPDNSISILSNIVLFSIVMENMASDILIEDTISQDFFENVPAADIEALRTAYKEFTSNGSTFAFDYDTLYEDYKGSSKSMDVFSFLITPVRGIVAIFIFITALAGGISWFNDREEATLANIPLNKQPFIKLMIISIPTILTAIAGYICLIVSGVCNNPLHELYVIGIYMILCIIFTYILTAIIGKNIFSALIPVFILGSVICCPIFINLANLIPAMKILQKLFLPTYYFIL